ncbi:MAG: TRAM domain-containing protein [Candidatus Nezhaarchaeota archaeon]|nr:TRAM domain-containing protein [Candidatus Nezhaarchaeota archaeon]MCX8141539.1 TRAM domain-containing protein [Candidatus Nezhaarchaeota archaeon]MDW8049806.1 TRAM domain-containing protein [Nitrososphaerota archaeon]
MRTRGGRGRLPKPVVLGQEYEVDITEVSRRGDGLARIQGFIIFVPGTQKGDKVRIRITKIGRSYAIGEVVE